MNKAIRSKFAVKPVVAALALAFSAVNAYADPPPLAQPGSGFVTAVTAGATFATDTTATTGFVIVGGGGVGSAIFDGYAASELRLMSPTPYARGVIRWGPFGGSPEVRNSAGFNVGALATLTFTTQAGVTDGAILNIDSSGFQSAIFGQVISSTVGSAVIPGGTGAAPSIFVANANGIIVGPNAHIVAPTGIGLLGANLNTTVFMDDFVANNNQVPAAPVYPPGSSYINIAGKLGPIDIMGGSIDGNTIASTPAQYILLAGSNVTNNGILFARDVQAYAGLTAVNQKGTVNGVTNVTVNRFWAVDQPGPGSVHNFTNCAFAGCLEILAANAASGFVNTGTIASKFLVFGGQIVIEAANGGLTSGIQGSTDQLIGLFADARIFLDSTGKTSLFNVNTGFTTGVTLPQLAINAQGGFGGDVLIEALTPVAQPSSITTTGIVYIAGADVVINSNVNFQVGINAANLTITSTKSFTTGSKASLGAGNNVFITNSGPGGINMMGPAVYSDLNGGAGGGVNITNANKGAATTIASFLATFFPAGSDDINVTVNGALTMTGGAFAVDGINITNLAKNAVTSISGGSMEALNDDINITVDGPTTIANNLFAYGTDVNIIQNSLTGGQTTTISGDVFAEHDIFIQNNGGSSTNLNITGSLTVSPAVGYSDITVLSGGNLILNKASATGVDDDIYIWAGGSKVMFTGAQTAGEDWEYHGPNAITKLLPAAVIQAGGDVILEALNFQGVNASGNPYATILEKPVAQIVANNVYATLYGSMNGPIAGNTYWPTNNMTIKALDPSAPVFFAFSAVGGGFQAINVAITGDAFVSSWLTRTPFDTVGFVSSVLLPPPLVANGGSSLILQATGNMDVVGNGAPFLLAPNAFEFPGGVVLIAGGVLTSQVPIYNAWTTNALQFQGIFKQAPTIVDNSYNATNTNSWVNYSTNPVTGPGNSYRIVESVPGVYQFILDPLIVHKNTYTAVLTGTPADYCAGGFPPYCP